MPMLFWFSPPFLQNHPRKGSPEGVVQDTRRVSHDNISATLLGLFEVRTELYEPRLELFGDDAREALHTLN